MSHTNCKSGQMPARLRRQAGVTVIELMVAVVIGAVLIFGAAQVYVDSRNTFNSNENVARLQETARYALSIVEPDIRLSNYWGLMAGAEGISGIGGSLTTICGNTYAEDLGTNVQGTNHSYSLGCAAMGAGAMPNADTLTIRHASSGQSVITAALPAVGPLRVCTTRSGGILTTDTTAGICLTAAPAAEIHDVVVNAYYVDKDSDQQAGLPSLRRYFLTYTGGAPDFSDAEITPGVEDMQVQYGVDTSGGTGTTSGAATKYLDAGATLTGLLTSATLPAQIVSVRIWLLVRAETPEVGFTDSRTYAYGDRSATNGTTGDLTVVADNLKAYTPATGADSGPNDRRHFRRVLISRTIQLRNALGT